MILSRTRVKFTPKCYLRVSSSRQFSSVRNLSERQILLRNRISCSVNTYSSVRNLSLSVPKLNESPVKEELIFQVPAKPAEAVPAEAVPAADPSELVFTIPEKPAPVDLSLLGEPSLDSLGLASYWPPGRLQYCLELVSDVRY